MIVFIALSARYLFAEPSNHRLSCLNLQLIHMTLDVSLDLSSELYLGSEVLRGGSSVSFEEGGPFEKNNQLK
jgi:hypothetical protein